MALAPLIVIRTRRPRGYFSFPLVALMLTIILAIGLMIGTLAS